MIEKIEWNGKKFALIVRKDFKPKGVDFITADDNPLQLGVSVYGKRTKIKPHIHKKSIKTIEDIQEVLHIVYGRVEAEFYDEEGKRITGTVLDKGDTILLLSGGHGFNILEDSKIIEIKQGPYSGVRGDKEYLNLNK